VNGAHCWMDADKMLRKKTEAASEKEKGWGGGGNFSKMMSINDVVLMMDASLVPRNQPIHEKTQGRGIAHPGIRRN